MATDTQSVNATALAKHWGGRIAARRRFLGLSQADLAKHVELDQKRISAFETGKDVPRDVVKLRIAGALRESVADLFPWPPAPGGAA